MEKKKNANPVCLVCGRPTTRLVCLLCAGRLRKEALREEIGDEKRGKRPAHLSRI